MFGKPGEARWFPPFKHRVENLSDTAYSGVYIGVKGKVPTGTAAKPGTAPLDPQTAKILTDYLLAAAAKEPGR